MDLSTLLKERMRFIKTKVGKIKQLRHKPFLTALTIVLSVGLGLFILAGTTNGQFKNLPQNLSSIVPINLASSDKASLDSLNFKNVERHEVSGAKKTVIYIPQIHKEPTTNASDPKNDNAAVVQKEIFGMLETLTDKNGVKYVMDETDIYGPMPTDKVQKIENGFSDIDAFRKETDQTIDHYLKDGGSKDVADQAKKSSEDAISKYERNIYLTGGAAVLAAKDDDVHVYGSQNQASIDLAKEKLQNLVYLENRIKELESTSSKTGRATVPALSSKNGISGALSALSSSSKTKNPFGSIQKFAQTNGDQALISDLDVANKGLKNLSTSKSFEATPKFSDTKKTANNPYSNSNDLPALKKAYDAAYQDFLKIAKDQRSQEVADNVVKMMDENGTDNAALVFGAGHKDQIVSALNAKGVNVIVVTPESEGAASLAS